MTWSRLALRILTGLSLALALAGCKERGNPGYQGWVEADMIFVSPDESGRVTKLGVREGDEVKSAAQLFAVDDELQRADLNQNMATLANAQQTYDRAASLSKTGSGPRPTSTPRSRRCGSPRPGSRRRRPGWRGASALRRWVERFSRSTFARARRCRRSGRCCRSCRPAT
jgi:Multidrug resistance efflux pump